MRTVCAWCRQEIKAGTEEQPSWGICDDCASKFANPEVARANAARHAELKDELDRLWPIDPRD